MQRTLSDNGRVLLKRLNPPPVRVSDIYHGLLVAPMWLVIVLFFVVYVAMNAVFAGAYLACGPGAIEGATPGSFADAFYFSIQTMTTIGYGRLLPATPAANLVVGLEVFTGLIGFALATGIMFAKFSRPSARVMFSRVMTWSSFMPGEPVLALRIANERRTQIAEAQARLMLLWNETMVDGGTLRRFHELKLTRSLTPVFALSWTVMHVVDEQSPLFGLDIDDLKERGTEFLVTLSGTDQAFMAPVHMRWGYEPDDIVVGARFADIFVNDDAGVRVLDFGRFHDTIPLPQEGG